MDKHREEELLRQLMAEISPKPSRLQKELASISESEDSSEESTESEDSGDRLDEVRTIVLGNLKDTTKLLARTPLPPRVPGASIYRLIGKERIIAISINFYNKVYRWEYQPFIVLFQNRLVALPIAIEDQAMLFMQWFGGPPVFSENKGNPAMRLRHAQFRITEQDADQWLAYMKEALDEVLEDNFPVEKQIIFDKMIEQAKHLVNVDTQGKRIYGPVPEKEYLQRIADLHRNWDREEYENSAEKIDLSIQSGSYL